MLRGLMSEITEEDARWKPVPERFSIAEVLAHLSHSDGDCYRARLDRFLSEEMPEFEPDDAQMHLELYKNGDPEEDFGHIEEQRVWWWKEIHQQIFFWSLPAAGGHNVSLIRTPDEQPRPLCGQVFFGNSVAFPSGKGISLGGPVRAMGEGFGSACKPQLRGEASESHPVATRVIAPYYEKETWQHQN
jgi:hypothetical protein